ncbi:MAG TPA: dihydrofolate reductase family protein [Vicinamibacterales bacterium]|nr:dihydrofolate reductase family protein [Vicinamibacterales bacterium]
MRTVILQEFVSLDGLAAGPNDSVDFVPASTQGDQAFGREQLAFIDTIDMMLLGRVTYEMFAGYWPKVTEGDDKPFADKLNALPKIVFSNTLDRAPWGKWDEARVVKTGATQEVAKLKRQPGKHMIVWGSISLAQALIDAQLIDEYRLVYCPVVLGSGRPLFRDTGDELDLHLLETKRYDLGAVSMKYVLAKDAASRKTRREPAKSSA